MKKRIFAAIAVIMMTAALSGCVMPKFTGEKYYYGRGKVKEQTYDVGAFTSFNLYSDAVLVYKKGECAPVKIEAQANLFETFTVEVADGTLKISENGNVQTDILPRVIVTAPEFDGVYIVGSSVSDESDTIKANSVILCLAGGGPAVDVEAGELRVYTAVGDVAVKGTADTAVFTSWGNISINGIDLHAREARVSVNNTGSASISCSEKLETEVYGSGNITYRGDPEVTQVISGTGQVIKID